jgi:hypothetical protein
MIVANQSDRKPNLCPRKRTLFILGVLTLIPFWILDLGFWIAECFTGKLFTNPFVAIIFPIGII